MGVGVNNVSDAPPLREPRRSLLTDLLALGQLEGAIRPPVEELPGTGVNGRGEVRPLPNDGNAGRGIAYAPHSQPSIGAFDMATLRQAQASRGTRLAPVGYGELGGTPEFADPFTVISPGVSSNLATDADSVDIAVGTLLVAQHRVVAQQFWRGTWCRGTYEVQDLTVDTTGGTFTITFEGQTTDPISGTATAAAVQTELELLSNVDADEIVVTGGPGDAGGTTPYVLTFAGGLRGDRTEITCDDALLTGGAGTGTPSTTTPGVDATEMAPFLTDSSGIGPGDGYTLIPTARSAMHALNALDEALGGDGTYGAGHGAQGVIHVSRGYANALAAMQLTHPVGGGVYVTPGGTPVITSPGYDGTDQFGNVGATTEFAYATSTPTAWLGPITARWVVDTETNDRYAIAERSVTLTFDQQVHLAVEMDWTL